MAEQTKRSQSPDALRLDLETHQEELLAQHRQLQHAQAELEASRDAYAELYDFAPFAYLTLDPNGVIQAANLTACTLLGKSRTALLSKPFYGFVVREDRPLFLDHLRRCRSGNCEIQSELRIKLDHCERPMLMQSKAVGSPPDVCRTVLFDLSERKAIEARVHDLNATLEHRVQERTAELVAINDALRREITQREQAERALKEADDRKDQFLAMLGHELRNPLAPIRHAAEVLKLAAPDDPYLRELGEVIERQSTHMSHIIDDLLDVTRISRGKINLQFETLDWRKLIEDEVHDFKTELHDSGQTLQLDLPDEPVWVRGDATRLMQVLDNLLSNAHKFTDQGGLIAITLRANARAGQATLSVTDNGIGVELDMLGRMFDTFSQADRSLDRTRGGLGLGLALVRGLLELHGGQVSAASAGLGRGTTITVSLPLHIESPATPAEPRTPTPRRRWRILVVDDRRDQLRMLEALLTRLGHDVYTASTGAEALQLAAALQPDVVFSDIGMPDIDGYAIARRLRSNPQLHDAFLVAVTGYGQPEDERRAYEAGFDRHFRKPVGLAELQKLLETQAT